MRRLLKATLIVTIFSILTRGLGFILRIILSRALGAEVLGHYQVAMSILGVLMTIIASGLPLIVSRNVAYKNEIGDKKGAHSSVTAGLIISLVLSVLLASVLFAFPEILSFIFRQGVTTSIVLFCLPTLIAESVYATLRSALWGEKRFFAMSFTEFFEQAIRIIICIILFSSAVLPGLGLGEKAALSLSAASIVTTVLVVIIYFAVGGRIRSPKGAFKSVIKSSTPITAVRTVSSLVSSLIALIIPLRLTLYGFTEAEAMAEFGMIMGMAFPLIMIPGTLISSLAVALVPEISGKTNNIDDKSSVRDFKGLKSHVNLAINVSVILSMIFVPAFIVLGRPICEILFGSSAAGVYVSRAAIIILPMGVSQITSSLLNSMGLEMKSLINYAISALFLFLSIFFLPKYIGTNALIVGMGLLSTITAILNFRMLKKRDLIENGFVKLILKVAGYGVVSAVLGTFIYRLLILFMPKFITTVIVGIICVAVMVAFYFMFNVSGIKVLAMSGKKRLKKAKGNPSAVKS